MLRSLFLVALVAVSCVAGTTPPTTPPTPTPESSPISATPQPSVAVVDDMSAILRAKSIPPADAFELVRRMKGRDGQPAQFFEPVRRSAPDEDIGTVREFWVYDFDAKRNVRVAAMLREMTERVKWWVATDISVDPSGLARSAQILQERIYPTNRRIFGEEWSPGIDGDPRINVLIARIPGAAAGYFSSTDELPRWVNEFSAEREIIYVNSAAARIGTDGFHAVLAHELCHMQQFNRRVRAVVWFNEGQAQMCERANGYVVGFEQLFLQQPDTQLDAWSDLDEGSAAHYGASFLFLEYLRHRAGGGYAIIDALMSAGVDTLDDVDRTLRARGQPGVEELFADFVAANAFIGSSPDPKLAYPAELRLVRPARASSQDRVAVGSSLRASVHQHAARYVELPAAGPYRVRFEGTTSTRVIPTAAHSGRAFWWSDRADGMDSTLTRTVDLRNVRGAALTFWTWYDIEKDFDYAYVAVSTDGGQRWQTLPAPGTTTLDVNGLNLGDGFTGTSGGGNAPIWVQQRVDLSSLAGKEILLRFEHVTDGALNRPGFAVDDIEIAEIGLRDDAETERGWDAKGFVRSTNVVKQRYVVQVLRFGARPSVERHVVEDGTLEIDVDPSGDRLPPLLAVTGLAPRTTESASFEVLVTARR
ncbi:MAG: hypothetical protein AAB114_05830 [Chloroflexota bacterium]